jgi:hypothetical protein
MNNIKAEKYLSINELRIGNLIDWERTTHIVRGLQSPAEGKDYGLIYSNWHDALDERPYIEPDNQHQGLFLNKNWFKLFGFKEVVGGVWSLGKYDFEQLWTDSTEWGFHIHEKEVDLTIEYVHELQNLYFALEGKELEYDIKDIKKRRM